MADQQTIPQSKATEAVVQVQKALNTTQDLLGHIHPSIAELAVAVTKLDGYMANATQLFRFIDGVFTILHDALQMCKYLGSLIPVVGPILADAAKLVEGMQIEQTVRKVLEEMESIIKKARNGVVKEVKAAANSVLSHLEDALGQLPTWIGTFRTMENLFGLIDIVVFSLFKDETEDFVKSILHALKEKSGGAFQKIELVKEALTPVKVFIEETWSKFKDALLKPLEAGFGAIMDTLKPVMNVIKACASACSHIKQWFEPFFWVLSAVEWIFEHTVGWLVNKVLNGLGLRGLIDDFKEKVLAGIGVDAINAIKDETEQLMGPILENLAIPLYEIADQTKASSMVNTVNEFAQEVQSFRRDPASGLLDVIREGLAKYLGNKDPNKPWIINKVRASDITSSQNVILAAMHPFSFAEVPAKELKPLLPTTNELERNNVGDEVAEVMKIQNSMDHFVTAVDVRLDSGDSTAEPKADTNSFLKFGYASYSDVPVSVLMRVTHRRVLEQHLSARKVTAASRRTGQAVQAQGAGNASNLSANVISEEGKSAGTSAASPSEGNSPNFDSYSIKHKELLDVMDSVHMLGEMEVATEQADAVFAAYTPEAAGFCDHFTSMLDGLDAILDASKGLLELPLHYRKGLTQNLVKWLKEVGLPAEVGELVPLLFATIDSVMKGISNFKDLKGTVQEESKNISAVFHAYHEHVAQICSSARFPKTLGYNITNYRSLMTCLQTRLRTSVDSFTVVRNIGQSIFQNENKLDGQTKDVFRQLDAVYAKLVPVIDGTIREFRLIPAQLERLRTSLDTLCSDVQVFYNAAYTASEQCRTVEAKVIAADRVKGFCKRVNIAIGPFESLLAQLGVQTDPPHVSPSGGPTPAEIVRIASQEARTPLKDFTAILSEAVVAGVEMLLVNFFHVSEVEQEMAKLGGVLQQPPASHIASFDAELLQLIKLVEPTRTTTYTMPIAPGSSKPAGPGIPLSNPLLDDSTAGSLGAILEEITAIARKLNVPSGSSVQIPNWARPGVDEQSVKQTYLLTWGRAWDEVEPNFPSRVFIDWYNLLQSLDGLMQQRQAWQRINANVPPLQHPPSTLTESGVNFWNLLEEKAVVGGSQYEPAIAKPFQKPLHERIDQLFKGNVQLPPGSASKDILKILPAPSEGPFLPPAALDQDARNLLAAFPDKKMPDALSKIVTDQAKFADVIVNLWPFLSAAGEIYTAANLPADAGIAALTGIHEDYNLMDARKLLELTSDEAKAREFVKLSGSEARLGK